MLRKNAFVSVVPTRSALPDAFYTCISVVTPLAFPFSRWREKVPKADEGGTADSNFVFPNASLTRGASRPDVSRQRESV